MIGLSWKRDTSWSWYNPSGIEHKPNLLGFVHSSSQEESNPVTWGSWREWQHEPIGLCKICKWCMMFGKNDHILWTSFETSSSTHQSPVATWSKQGRQRYVSGLSTTLPVSSSSPWAKLHFAPWAGKFQPARYHAIGGSACRTSFFLLRNVYRVLTAVMTGSSPDPEYLNFRGVRLTWHLQQENKASCVFESQKIFGRCLCNPSEGAVWKLPRYFGTSILGPENQGTIAMVFIKII
jgi:hypothetical protein